MTDPRWMRPGLNFARGKAIEEMGELQAALGKSLRWGWHSVNPDLPPEQQETNAQWIYREANDVRDALDNLIAEMRQAASCHPLVANRIVKE
jgi:hypothetical protein